MFVEPTDLLLVLGDLQMKGTQRQAPDTLFSHKRKILPNNLEKADAPWLSAADKHTSRKNESILWLYSFNMEIRRRIILNASVNPSPLLNKDTSRDMCCYPHSMKPVKTHGQTSYSNWLVCELLLVLNYYRLSFQFYSLFTSPSPTTTSSNASLSKI